ncbi:DJ-1 family glyoxalase III [Fusibacter sp. 3D3]|uniref:DJ-1 family glyoxalase III n=1 Tax=Fusibacter sp. 3D3 TaxID=1048380 RepID=UPI000853BF36|nr:DJ-1 family glyoxalase III [Fusibacter sp. 3D3]GAU76941.1 4-methyl-5(B-hydroxyethyl)-thiazole monophosphate biosynthesis enzyme [Fusibacter sp. 3D3]
MVYIFFATGFEEVEALATVDVLRRADIDVKMVGINGREITGGHGITIKMDTEIELLNPTEKVEMLVLPGGVPGIDNLKANRDLEALVKKGFEEHVYIAAICAAPSVLYDWGLIDKRKVTAYPNFLKKLDQCIQVDEPVVQDGKLITGRGVGVALEFALKLVTVLKGSPIAEALSEKMVMPTMESR